MTNFQKFISYISEKKLIHMITPEMINWLINNGYFTAPASTKYHGNHEGGLFEHSLCVADKLDKLTIKNDLCWQRMESPYIIGLFHDLCKCDQYVKNEDGTYRYNTEADRRHAEKSIEILERFIGLTDEERLCIRFHMGAYRTEDWENHNFELDDAIALYENVMWTHWADMLASKKYGT